MYYTDAENTSRIELESKQMVVHLLRLEDLYLEHFTLVEKCTRSKMDRNRDLILSAKAQEAIRRATVVAQKLRDLLSRYESTVDAAHVSLAARAVTCVCGLSVTDSAAPPLRLVTESLHAAGLQAAPEWSPFLAQWLRQQYSTRYVRDYLPHAATLTMVQTSLAHDAAEECDRKCRREEGKRRRAEYERAREARRIRLAEAKERLSIAQRNVFTVRKAIFALYERITVKKELATGEKLDGLVSQEVLRRIKEDILAGDLDFLLMLSKGDGGALREIFLGNASDL